jgi:hypothetical protein
MNDLNVFTVGSFVAFTTFLRDFVRFFFDPADFLAMSILPSGSLPSRRESALGNPAQNRTKSMRFARNLARTLCPVNVSSGLGRKQQEVGPFASFRLRGKYVPCRPLRLVWHSQMAGKRLTHRSNPSRSIPRVSGERAMFKFDPRMEKWGGQKYSQNDEDGVLDYIFSILPPGPRGRFFVEFGIGPAGLTTLETLGLEGNCRLLKEKGWRGLFLDEYPYPAKYGVKQARVDALNINPILRKYRVPEDVDLISIDIDGQDFWVWSNLAWHPRVIVIEYNANFGIRQSKVIPFDASYRWDGTKWFGASLRALYNLGKSKGYVLVYANGVNAFFIQDRLVRNKEQFVFKKLYRYRNVHRPDKLRRPWTSIPEVAD